MDLRALSPSRAAQPLHLVHPVTGKPLYLDDEAKTGPIILHLFGQDSKEHEAAKQQVAQAKVEGLRVTGGGAVKGLRADVDDQLVMTVACVAGWENLNFNGEVREFSPEAAREVLEEVPWIEEQARAFIYDRANFLGK